MKGFQAFGQIPSPTFTAIELPFAIGCGVSVRAGHRNTFEPAGTERARLTFALETSQKAHLTCNHSLMCASVRACMGVGVSVAVNVGVSVSVCVCVCACACAWLGACACQALKQEQCRPRPSCLWPWP